MKDKAFNIDCMMRFVIDRRPRTRNGVTAPLRNDRYNLASVFGSWEGIEKMKTAKGFVYLTKIPASKRRDLPVNAPEYNFNLHPAGYANKTINFSGLYMTLKVRGVVCASGWPEVGETTCKGTPNPFYNEREDGYIFVFAQDNSYFDLIVIKDGKGNIDYMRDAVALGRFDEEISAAREQLKPYVI